MEQLAIKIENVSKLYKLYNKPSERLYEALSITKKIYHKEFYALNNINLQINTGQAIGIIGTNGSGKSTLLKIISGVLTPTTGNVEVCGKIAALLELGAGFNPEYSGIDNIYLNGTIMGYSKDEMKERIEHIIEFADIGEFINQPVKTYSSGMFARLAFAVSINVEPDILIVDEALSVGDIRFQQKCFRKMEEIKKQKTVLMVTHDLGAVTRFCDKVIWIEKGTILDFGDPIDITKKYQAFLMQSKLSKTSDNSIHSEDSKQEYPIDIITDKFQSYGNKDSEIVGIGMFRQKSMEKIHYIKGGDNVKIVIKVINHKPLVNGIIGITVFDRLGNNVFGINSFLSNDYVDSNKEISQYECTFVMPDLNEGPYTISPAIAVGTQNEHTMVHWVYDAYEIQMVSPNTFILPGILALSNFSFKIIE